MKAKAQLEEKHGILEEDIQSKKREIDEKKAPLLEEYKKLSR